MTPTRRRTPLKRAAQAESPAEGGPSAADETPAKRTRVAAEAGLSDVAPPQTTPRRSARLQAASAQPEALPSPVDPVAADDGNRADEAIESAGAHGEPQYSRIKLHRGKWRPLIPTTLNASAFAVSKRKTLDPFGAAFPSAEGAARAADRALVAMWGLAAAAPLLNFPPAQLAATEQRQRYGRELTAFLQVLAAEGDALRAAEKAACARAAPLPAHWVESNRQNRRLRRFRAALLVDEAEPCGLCPACRQPWLGQGCHRAAAAKKIGYKAKAAAERAAAEAGEATSEEDEAAASVGDGQAHRRRGGVAATGRTAQQKPGAAAAGAGPAAAAEVLIWKGDPPKHGPALRGARRTHTKHVESLHLRAEAEAAEEAAAEAAALAAALAAARPQGPARAAPPRDFVQPPPHPALLRDAATAAALGATLALMADNAPHWALPPPPAAALAAQVAHKDGGDPDGGASMQCPLCMGWHGPRTVCPLVTEALATAVPTPTPCPHCAGAEVPGCTRCGRGGLPAAVWIPPSLPAPWLPRVVPGTVDVMAAARRLAGAAAADFDRPDVADRLGPGALLAMGLLAEEVAAAGLGAAPAPAPPRLYLIC